MRKNTYCISIFIAALIGSMLLCGCDERNGKAGGNSGRGATRAEEKIQALQNKISDLTRENSELKQENEKLEKEVASHKSEETKTDVYHWIVIICFGGLAVISIIGFIKEGND